MQELNLNEINEVSGGVTSAQVLNIGGGVTAVGAAVLIAVGSPILVPGAAAFGLASAFFFAGGALVDAGFGGSIFNFFRQQHQN
jgi:hypothetical protein